MDRDEWIIWRYRTRPGGRILAALALLLASVLVVPSRASAATPTPIDDFEDGDTSDWIFFGGNDAGGGGGPAADRPYEGEFYLSTGWGGQGTASGFYGGAFTNLPDDGQVSLPVDPWFNVWVLNQSDATADAYTLEITIREDLDGDGWTDGADDSFRLDRRFTATDFDDTWTLISGPVAGLTDLATGGDGTFDGALDEVVIVVAGVEGATGSTVEVDFDLFAFSSGGPLDDGGPIEGAVIADFEDGVAPGTPCAPSAPPLGFCTFSGAGSAITLSNPTAPPAPLPPEAEDGSRVLQADVESTSFAGFINGFESGGTWTTQDWSTSEGISLWFYGAGSGTSLFIDILDNRNPASTTDDAERYTVAFSDDVAGWQRLEFPFSSFTRKEIGNGAPNDGLGLFEMHGWAFGTLGTGGAQTFYLDDVRLYGDAEPPALAVQLAVQNTFVTEGTTGEIVVRLNRPIGPDDPAEVTVVLATERSNAESGLEFTPISETVTFVRGGPSEIGVPIETFDDTKFEGDEQIIVRLTDAVGAERGSLFQGSVLIDDDDPFDPDLLDDFEQGAFQWDTTGPVELSAVRSETGTAVARPDQDAVENVLVATVPRSVEAEVRGRLCGAGNGVVTVHLLSTDGFDATTIDHATVRIGDASETHVDRRTGEPRRHVDDVDGDGRDDLVIHVRASEIGPWCDASEVPINGATLDGGAVTAGGSAAAFGRDFPIPQDWTGIETIDFWYEGSGTGEVVVVTLADNRAPDPGPSGWTLAWADEFDDPAGTPPDPGNWGYEIGDVTPDGKNGWGNEELQFYTDDPANAATDGAGNLVITLDEADGTQECYYGPCEYTSARLLTQHRAEFAYGRIEARLQVPDGGDGLWPAFWSLGTDITYNPWPAAGEIDIMEYVSRLPEEIFGTIHGPGYNGGGSFSGIYDFGERVDLEYHTYAVEWQPELITWYVDGIQYHQATPADVAPNPWVFEKPFFLLLNFAIGGNFGGPVDPANTYPQEYLIDYVRVYQGADTAERFEATFVDDVAGWRRVSVPLADFVRSDDQPVGAPDDGLGLDEVWGYGFAFPEGNGTGEIRLDLVEVTPIPPPTELVVTTVADSGPGSLRDAMARIADGGTIGFDPSLAGATIDLTSGQLTAVRSMTIDGSTAPGIVVSGGGRSRVLEVAAGFTVALSDLVVADGAAAPRGGGILNLGALDLQRVVVRDNTENSAGPANFEFGGGGIYNGTGATLNLVDSTVAGNVSLNQPAGGIFGFFDSTITITGTAISGNRSASDVAGGLRSLGDITIVNSTFSGNVSTAWHGGGVFHTDGALRVTNSTFSDNVAPAGTASGILVATFGAPASAVLTNNVLQAGGGAVACAIEGGGAATITSGGSNVIGDGSCNPDGATDQSFADALLAPLADNGGPTLTHLPGAGSPALDTADGSACPPIDQRGVPRPQGGACDAGAVEVEFTP